MTNLAPIGGFLRCRVQQKTGARFCPKNGMFFDSVTQAEIEEANVAPGGEN